MRAEGALVPDGGRTRTVDCNCLSGELAIKGTAESPSTLCFCPPPLQHESCGVLASLVGELEGESTQTERQGLEGR